MLSIIEETKEIDKVKCMKNTNGQTVRQKHLSHKNATTAAHITNQDNAQLMARYVQSVKNLNTLNKYAETWPETGHAERLTKNSS